MLPPTPLPHNATDATAQLHEALEALCFDVARPSPRDSALGVFRRHLARIQHDVREAFESGQLTGLPAARRLARLTDGLIATLYDYACEVHGTPEHLAVSATGGYGRQVLAPFSDIDLLFVTAASPPPETLRVVEFMLYFLWDLGLKVGHATRSVAECLAEADRDTTIRTSLLDARLLVGNAALYQDFAEQFEASRTGRTAVFVAAKQAERDARHRRYGDSPFVVEPNIKEGRGGLRDLQTLYWFARSIFGITKIADLAEATGPAAGIITVIEARMALRSWDFLWSLRFHLHYVAGRAEDRLTFDLQPVVGARMGYTRHGRQDGVERFMRHYFLTAREVTRLTHVLEPALLRAALGPPAVAPATDAELVKGGFVLADGQLLLAKGRDFKDEPILMLRMLQVARDRNLVLHPLAMRALIRNERRAIGLRENPEAAGIFHGPALRP